MEAASTFMLDSLTAQMPYVQALQEGGMVCHKPAEKETSLWESCRLSYMPKEHHLIANSNLF